MMHGTHNITLTHCNMMHINTLQYDARYIQRHINTLQYDARHTQRHINTLQYDARYIQR